MEPAWVAASTWVDVPWARLFTAGQRKEGGRAAGEDRAVIRKPVNGAQGVVLRVGGQQVRLRPRAKIYPLLLPT